MLKQIPVHPLLRDRSDHMWRPITFQHINQMEQFVEGPINNVSLPYNLELWFNQEHQDFQEEGPTLIITDLSKGKELLFFGNCFLTSIDPNQQITSLTTWQTDYIYGNSELLKSLTPDIVSAVLLNIEVESIQ